jgi:hypothetical protein
MLAAKDATILITICLLVVLALAVPRFVHAGAQANLICVKSRCEMDPQTAAKKHVPVCTTVKCFDTEQGGIVSGFCGSPTECKGQTYTNGGKSSGVDQGLSALGQILGQLMGKLMQNQNQQGGAGAGAGVGTTGTGTNGSGCTSYYPTSVPSSDPCAYYVPNLTCTGTTQTLGSIPITVSSTTAAAGGTSNGKLSVDVSAGPAPLTVAFSASGIGTLAFGDGGSVSITTAGTTTHTYSTEGTFTAVLSTTAQCTNSSGLTSSSLTSGNDLLNALGGGNTGGFGSLTGGISNISDVLNQTANQSLNNIANGNTNTNTNTNSNSNAGATSSAATNTVQLSPNLGGAQGNIQLIPNGATIVANTVDTTGNTAVAGFYGADTLGAQQPQGLVAQLCQSRPWAGNFLSYIIPSTFFDGLCQWRGYQVGAPVTTPQTPQANVTLTQHAVPATKTSTSSVPTTGPSVPPKVQIWAVPAAVQLGARTTINWTTQGVSNCVETSPDGSFSQNSLRGSGATVPLTGATTFTISCQAPDGTPVTDYITVNIAI